MFKMRSRLLAGAMCAVLAAMLIVPAAAHGCRGGRGHHRQSVQAAVTVCPYEDCTEAGRHTHNGVLYCGYSHSGGVCDGACLALCPFEDCELTGRHTHDGVTYCGYSHEAGYCDGACLALCPFEDCELTGRHIHDGETYCGASHDCGYCDGACAVRAHHGCGRWA